MKIEDVQWDKQAQQKIVTDAHHVLQQAVSSVAASMAGKDSDQIFAALNHELKDKFIDYAPGPDIRRYADLVAAGEFDSAAGELDS